MKIAYEKHPVSPERKKELRDKGFKIIDAQFDPDPKPAKSGSGVDKASKGLNVDEIKAKLTEKGIDFDPSANKPVLAELLDNAAE